MIDLYALLKDVRRVTCAAAAAPGACGATQSRAITRGAYELRVDQPCAVKVGAPGETLTLNEVVVLAGECFRFVLHSDETVLLAAASTNAVNAVLMPMRALPQRPAL